MAQRDRNEFTHSATPGPTKAGCAAGGCLGATGVSVALIAILASISFTTPSCDLNFDTHDGREECTQSSSRLVRATTTADMKPLKRYLAADDDPDEEDDDGNRPLACAALMGNLPAVTALLDAGADPKLTGEAGGRAIVAAISGDGRGNDEDDPDPDDRYTAGPQELTGYGLYEPLDSDDRLAIVAALVEHGVDPTPSIGPAVDLHSVEAVRVLLRLGADPDGETNRATPLTTAAMIIEGEDLGDVAEDHEIIDLLLAAKADPDEGGCVDSTQIAFALPSEIRDGVTWVTPTTTTSTTTPPVSSDSSSPTSTTVPTSTTGPPAGTTTPDTTTPDTSGPIKRSRCKFITDYSLFGGPGSGPVPPLVAAAISGDSWAVKRLLDHGANPNVRAITHYTPLWAAVVARSDESITMLLAAGADPRPEVAEVATPIWVANDDGDVRLVERLLKAPRPG